jgi:hypothetical protein
MSRAARGGTRGRATPPAPHRRRTTNTNGARTTDPIGQHAAEVINCAFVLSRAVRRYRVAIANAAILRDDDFPF